MADELQAFVGSAFLAVTGYFLWRKGMKQRSLMIGTPTSKIATAAKGFVELSGWARPVCAAPLHDPITHRQCLWFEVRSEEREGWFSTKWRVVGSAKSTRPIAIQDSSATCAVVGEVSKDKPDQVIRETYMLRHTLWHIRTGDPLYVLGHIDRLGSPHDLMKTYSQHDKISVEAQARYRKVNEHASRLVRWWKQDQRRLLARFDANDDGVLDAEEWNTLREAAQLEARKKVGGGAAEPQYDPAYFPLESITHWVRAPADGRPLIIAKGKEAEVTKRVSGSRRIGLVMFLLGGFMLIVLLRGFFGTD